MATLVGIYYKDSDKKLVSSQGLMLNEDISPSKDPDRQLSLISEGVEKRLREDQIKGFCHLRFKANLIIDTLDIDMMYKKQVIRIGDALFEITSVGKECHSNCPRLMDLGDCNINKQILFGRLIEPGEVRIGDILHLNLTSKD